MGITILITLIMIIIDCFHLNDINMKVIHGSVNKYTNSNNGSLLVMSSFVHVPLIVVSGSCSLPTTLQGVDPIPIISDSECTSRWGSSFNSALMICVYNGSQGSCNVWKSFFLHKHALFTWQNTKHRSYSFKHLMLVLYQSFPMLPCKFTNVAYLS